jgi:hypothetical protein
MRSSAEHVRSSTNGPNEAAVPHHALFKRKRGERDIDARAARRAQQQHTMAQREIASIRNSALVGVQQWVDEGSLVPESSE